MAEVSEKVIEDRIFIVHMLCDQCRKGLMEWTGRKDISYPYPPEYLHKCNNCGYRDRYPLVYPYKRAIPLKELPMSDHLEIHFNIKEIERR